MLRDAVNTYLIGVLITLASAGVWPPCAAAAAAYCVYALALTRGIAMPYAAFVGGAGYGCWELSQWLCAAHGWAQWQVTLLGLGTVLASFTFQLVGHALHEDFSAPPLLFHGFVAAPLLEYMSLVFRIGGLPTLRADVFRAVEKIRNASPDASSRAEPLVDGTR